MQKTEHLQRVKDRSTQPTKNTETLSKLALIPQR
jgi:hypothetical protein